MLQYLCISLFSAFSETKRCWCAVRARVVTNKHCPFVYNLCIVYICSYKFVYNSNIILAA